MNMPQNLWLLPAFDDLNLPLSPNDILQVARNHPAYVDHNLPYHFDDVIPQDKTMLFHRLARFLDQANPANRRGLYVTPTGGTGIAGHGVFIAGSEENRIQRSWLANILGQEGLLSHSSSVLNLFQAQKMYRSLEIINDFCVQVGATVLPMESRAENDLIYQVGFEFQANMLAGLPTRLVDFASYLTQRGLSLPIKRILYGGDSIRLAQRLILERAFPDVQFVALFGSAEAGIWGYHRSHDPPNVFHFDPRMMHMEIWEPDEDGTGEMILTNLVRRRFPLLRYRTGDRVKWIHRGAERCSFLMLGRIYTSFALGDNYLNLKSLEPYLSSLLAYQLVLEQEANNDLLVMKIVPPNDWSEEQLMTFESSLHEFLVTEEVLVQAKLEVQVVSMDLLERSPTSGKIKPIIDLRVL